MQKTARTAKPKSMKPTKVPTSFPPFYIRGLYDEGKQPSFTTAESLLLPDALATHVAALTTRPADEASTLLAGWVATDAGAQFLLQFALTDETWAAARAAIDPIKRLDRAYLPFGVGMLGLAIVPRLIEAHASKKISKHARFAYRHAIVAALAVEASRGNTWPAAYDEYLRFDPAGWWFAQTPTLYGNWHLDLQLQHYVMPLLKVAIAALPAARARPLLDEGLAGKLPVRFPMAFFALPCLRAHWAADTLAKATDALRWYHDGGKGDGNEPCKESILNDLRELDLFEKVMIELYRTGHWNDRRYLGFEDDEAFLAKAKKALPARAYARLAADVT